MTKKNIRYDITIMSLNTVLTPIMSLNIDTFHDINIDTKNVIKYRHL